MGLRAAVVKGCEEVIGGCDLWSFWLEDALLLELRSLVCWWLWRHLLRVSLVHSRGLDLLALSLLQLRVDPARIHSRKSTLSLHIACGLPLCLRLLKLLSQV